MPSVPTATTRPALAGEPRASARQLAARVRARLAVLDGRPVDYGLSEREVVDALRRR